MPFTLSHPAAVLPLRRYGVFSALIFGSMAPDFLYFVPGHNFWRYGHTLPGLFFFCLPASWICLWLFHCYLRRPLTELFPERVAGSLRAAAHPFDFGLRPFRLARIGAISGSIFLGAVTHILWDATTHVGGFIADNIPYLLGPLLNTSRGTILRVQLLQELSTWLGALVLWSAFHRWRKNAPAAERPGALALSPSAKVGLISLAVLLALAYAVPTALRPLHYSLKSFLQWEYFLRVTVIVFMRTGLMLLLIYCAVWNVLAARRPAAPPAG